MDALATLATLVTNNNNEEVPNDPGKMFIGKEETNTQIGYFHFYGWQSELVGETSSAK